MDGVSLSEAIERERRCGSGDGGWTCAQSSVRGGPPGARASTGPDWWDAFCFSACKPASGGPRGYPPPLFLRGSKRPFPDMVPVNAGVPDHGSAGRTIVPRSTSTVYGFREIAGH
ncbi:hypothetical protein K461DRAFT_309796 [Myriangium duriaei CBS 260.36]|uniref:Uncharacterized protein n=1 Tax=Myriangium duriaei CBS 260.36 TaxID=1168546 RepID=A0A9P4JA80_9PEZI|nr:hypothetical protein K461DRAFT_309796 [Myriangium duriaei CBS 260.36]